jgi:hypothetical protein
MRPSSGHKMSHQNFFMNELKFKRIFLDSLEFQTASPDSQKFATLVQKPLKKHDRKFWKHFRSFCPKMWKNRLLQNV